MANKKFHTKIDPTDISIQAEDGGGIQFNQRGKFFFGAKQQNVIDELVEQNYTGNVDINANNQSFIAIMNQNSENIDVEVPVNHFSSLNAPTNNIVTTTSSPTPVTSSVLPTNETSVSSSIAPPQPTQPPTKEEVPPPPDEEGLYDANFLPASEDVNQIQIGEDIEITDYTYDEITDTYIAKKTYTEKIFKDTNINVESVSGFKPNTIKYAFNFFLLNGYNSIQSSGIIGALLGESGLKTNAVQRSSTGALGIGQWLGGRLTKFLSHMGLPTDYAKVKGSQNEILQYRLNYIQNNPQFINGPILNNLEKQLDFIIKELKETKIDIKIKKTTFPAQAATVFESNYERPAYNEKYYRKIQGYANDVFNKYAK